MAEVRSKPSDWWPVLCMLTSNVSGRLGVPTSVWWDIVFPWLLQWLSYEIPLCLWGQSQLIVQGSA